MMQLSDGDINVGRKLISDNIFFELGFEEAENVIYEIMRLFQDGLISDAIRQIECFTHPKWPSLEACEKQYKKAMNQ